MSSLLVAESRCFFRLLYTVAMVANNFEKLQGCVKLLQSYIKLTAEKYRVMSCVGSCDKI